MTKVFVGRGRRDRCERCQSLLISSASTNLGNGKSKEEEEEKEEEEDDDADDDDDDEDEDEEEEEENSMNESCVFEIRREMKMEQALTHFGANFFNLSVEIRVSFGE